MLKLMLNLHKPNNYAFFCPVSKVHLTVSSPVGFANEATPAILRAIKAKTVLDVDGVLNLETGSAPAPKAEPKKSPAPEQPAPKVQDSAVAPQAESTESKGAEAPVDAEVEPAAAVVEEKATTKKSKKAAKETE